MTSMLPHRRRADELADAIEGRRPAQTAEIRELVAVAAAIQSTPAVVPRGDFTAELRAQLVAAAHRELSSPGSGEPTARAGRPQRSGFRRLGVAAATGAFIVVGGTTGIASASETALPGDLLYLVKRGVEQIDLRLATSEAERGRLELEFAQTRLQEVRKLLDSDDPVAQTLIAETLDDFTDSARDGSELILESEDTSDSVEAATLVNAFAVDSSKTLRLLATDFDQLAEPVDAVKAFSGAADMMAEIDDAANEECATCLDDEDSVSVTDPGGGDPPVLTVLDPEGKPVVSVTVPDIEGAGGSAGPPAVGSGHVHPEAPEVPGGTGGYLPTSPPLPTTAPDTAPGGGGPSELPPAITAPPASTFTAPSSEPAPVEPQPTDPTEPTFPTVPTPAPPTPPTPTPPATESPAQEQPSPVPETPETTGDVDSETASEAPETEGDTQSEPVPTAEPTYDIPAEPLPESQDPLDPSLADDGGAPTVAVP